MKKFKFRYVGQEDSGMVLMEISFPSGYEPVHPSELQNRQSGSYDLPGRIEKDRGNLVLYYNQVHDYIWSFV